MVGYPKFDLVDDLPQRPCRSSTGRADVVLYNPHFHTSLGSWPKWGKQVLEFFAADDRYNLIFAPHIRLFETASTEERAAFKAFAEHPRIHIDLGGPAAAT
jgi:hypothetical protein